MRRKRHAFFLALSIYLPPFCIMSLAAMDLIYSQVGVKSVVRSYVENLTEYVAHTIDMGSSEPGMLMHIPPYANHDWRLGIYNYLGIGRMPGLLAIVDENNIPIFGSSKLMALYISSGEKFPMGSAKELYDENGEFFTVAVYPSYLGDYLVIGAVSWRDIPGFTKRAVYLWPILMGSAGLWSAMSVWNLWQRVIIPLRNLEAEVSVLKWGEEIPAEEGPIAIYELRRLRLTFVKVARDALKRVSIIRSCMRDMVSVQETERTKISREIHDGPLQDVTALIQRIRLARSEGCSPDEMNSELDLAEKIAHVSVKELRGLCDFLNPPWLELGLEQALTELTERLSAQYGVRVFLDVEEGLDLPEAVTLAFFRVAQEAVTNSVRHGEAKHIWVDVKSDENGIELCVQDDGHGFNMADGGTAGLRAEGHRGLSNMEERLTLVGGRLKVISYPGEGTCIRGLVP
ncbi:MAG: sensor histidine kinase [Synergistaceae bacterium]|jgi:signal transduction histidine kinase|nr:sensor histidine kinase [Synergistaceae bacterium]